VTRGRPPAHTRDQVVDAAIAIADAEGSGAVTIRRIAADLGTGAMSLYTYVPDKERLVDLMVDRVAGRYPPPAAPTGDWRADLLTLVRRQRTMMREHPWITSALPNRGLSGTNLVAYLEAGLAALAPTDLAGPAKMEVLALLTGFVASYVTNEQAPVDLDRRVAELRAAIADGALPHLAAVLATPGGAQAPDFDRIATRMINGLVTT
jgi:AcrR family transcriptional regulator